MSDYGVRADNTLEVDHNPYMAPWEKPTPNNVAGKGSLETPGRMPNLIWQTRAAPPSAYENAVADALEQVFDGGAQTLDEVVAGLNRLGVRLPDGRAWTPALFESEMARLGA
jgi:hypothetical protein